MVDLNDIGTWIVGLFLRLQLIPVPKLLCRSKVPDSVFKSEFLLSRIIVIILELDGKCGRRCGCARSGCGRRIHYQYENVTLSRKILTKSIYVTHKRINFFLISSLQMSFLFFDNIFIAINSSSLLLKKYLLLILVHYTWPRPKKVSDWNIRWFLLHKSSSSFS